EGLSFHGKKGSLVQFGSVHKKILKHFAIGQEVLFADVDWTTVLETLETTGIKKVSEVPKYPSVKRDFALLLDESVPFKKIKTLALDTERKLLKNVQLFDVYTGKNLPKGKKSYAVGYTLQDPNKTLTDKQVDKVMQKLQKTYERELGATLR
ncbi:MAG: phenylalanine--tRNA ligase subunit beta, partial [Flavobacteriaceae bacterium]